MAFQNSMHILVGTNQCRVFVRTHYAEVGLFLLVELCLSENDAVFGDRLDFDLKALKEDFVFVRKNLGEFSIKLANVISCLELLNYWFVKD